jgi:hypothetical protein
VNDGVNTEITGEGISDDTEVVTGEVQVAADGGGATKNPFVPQMPRRGGGNRR